ncbi:hypothetical protein [Algoriphagus algorifonticola]|uniref:hypothetical protein n=1 Tax=Algoriphagus algorifonticola TaxID=2593007 RepID=UPI00119F0B24|nr:hypothetical protein [Algoriphagus algorifonticola]
MSKSIYTSLLMLLWFSTTFAQVSLRKVSEFKIDSFYEVGILDYFEKDQIYLGYTKSKDDGVEISLFDAKGNKIISRNLYGEGPNEHVSPLSGLAFTEDGNIWAKTPIEILLYDLKLNLIKKTRFNPLNTSTIYYPEKLAILKNSVGENVVITTITNTFSFSFARNFESLNLIEGVNLKSGKSTDLIPARNISIFSKMDISMKNMLSAIYTQSPDGKQLFVTTSFDNQITIFDSRTLEKKDQIEIDHESFDALKSSKLSLSYLPQFKGRILSARNFALHAWDNGYLALEYLRDISLGIFEKKLAELKSYDTSIDPDYHRLILFKDGKQISGDIRIPYGEIQMALPGNRLLIRLINPDKEEDFMRFGIFEIK